MARTCLLLCALAALSACRATRHALEPVLHPKAFYDDLVHPPPAETTVVLGTGEATELGVSTEYGIVFLGRTTQTGNVAVTAWFKDGPSWEDGLIEMVAPGLFTTQTEIKLPAARLSFLEPRRGTEVVVHGRRRGEDWEIEAEVARDERVSGLLLRMSSELRRLGPDQVGAGVYVEQEGETRLLGLLAGRVTLTDPDGNAREYAAVVGPQELWRLVTYRRNLQRARRWVYREDIL